jgi:orotidine-5'-phosphate decarboxylase
LSLRDRSIGTKFPWVKTHGYNQNGHDVTKTKMKEKIILALDLSSPEEARKTVETFRGEVGAFKIGLQLFTAAGASFVRELTGEGVKIFLDLKFHDIPNTVASAAVEAARMGVWMFNVHALGGGEMMRETAGRVRAACARENLAQPKMIAVTVLTSSDAETLRETGIVNELSRQVLNLALLASECEMDGVVASPREIALIREGVKRENFLIVTPGVRPTSKAVFATADDQKRVMTPAEAIAAGSDHLVIGRPILKAGDSLAAVREIIREMENAQTN